MTAVAEAEAGAEIPIRGCTVSGLLRRAARRFAAAEAVVSPERGARVSFAALDARADRVAAACIARGLAAGDRAVVWAPNLPEWIELQYGLARAGVVLVTANTSFKLAEIRYVLEKSGARALFFARGARDNDFQKTVAELARDLPPRLALLAGLDGARLDGARLVGGGCSYEEFLATGGAVAADRVRARETALATGEVINMQYTSGTTGFPKGVMLSHTNIVENAATIARIFGLRPGDRLCLAVPLFHCFGCVIGTLAAHGSGVAMVLNDVFQADAILDAVESERCTCIYGVPTMYVAELEAQRRRPRDLGSLRVGAMAGAACPEQLVKDVARELHIPGIIVGYGLTEASPGVTFSSPADDLELRATTVGRAMPGIEVRLVDPESGATIAPGSPGRGELWTRGPHVMQGYDGEPAATAAAVTPDGWLRTGDLAEHAADGCYRIAGRIKELIIRGGENLSPGEIEDVLRRHPKVLDAAVFGIPSEFFGEEVAAAIRLAPGAAAVPDELRAFVAERLARQKAPVRFLFVDQFPLTGSGKVQRFKLQEMAARMPAS